METTVAIHAKSPSPAIHILTMMPLRPGGSAGGFDLWDSALSRLKFGSARRAAPTLGFSIRVHLPAFAGCSRTADDCRFYNAPSAPQRLCGRNWFVGSGGFPPVPWVRSASRPLAFRFVLIAVKNAPDFATLHRLPLLSLSYDTRSLISASRRRPRSGLPRL
jgi:hypothetical protein